MTDKNFEERIFSMLVNGNESPAVKLSRSWDNIMEHVHLHWNNANTEVRGLLGLSVDEIALYFPDQDLLLQFIKRAVKNGWVLFNHVEDEVTTGPINSMYGVQYWFLRKEGLPYRLELMQVIDGFSPYHGTLQEACDLCQFPVLLAHASFKVEGESAYGTAVFTLRNAGFELMQHCTSSYGKFSYMIDQDRKYEIAPIKPRINTRDAQDTRGSDAEQGEF